MEWASRDLWGVEAPPSTSCSSSRWRPSSAECTWPFVSRRPTCAPAPRVRFANTRVAIRSIALKSSHRTPCRSASTAVRRCRRTPAPRGVDSASAATVVVESCRESGGEGGESGGEGGGRLERPSALVICSRSVTAATAARRRPGRFVPRTWASEGTRRPRRARPCCKAGSVGATPRRWATPSSVAHAGRGRMWALLMKTSGADAALRGSLEPGAWDAMQQTMSNRLPLAGTRYVRVTLRRP